MKKISVFLCFLLMFCSLGFTAFAEEPSAQIPDEFIEQCHYFFRDKASIAYDKNNNDISEEFYNDNISYYTNKDYAAIRSSYLNDLSSFSRPFQTTIQSRGIVTGYATSEEVYTTVKSKENGNADVRYIISAKYRCQESSHEIIDHYTPTVAITYHNAGSLFQVGYTNMNYVATLYNSNSQIRFDITFNLTIDYAPYGIILRPETATPEQSKTIYGYAI